MGVFVLLDILLLMLIALFVPIGFWRGAHREVFVTLGILVGASLAEWWARPWGRDLADYTQLRESGGAFMVAVLFLVGSTFILGYGAGAALLIPPSRLISRIFGALIAAANGALLLSFALRAIRVYLLPDQDIGFLDRAVVAHFLSTGVGWLLLGGAALFAPIVLALALFGREAEVADFELADEEFESGYTPVPVPRRYPPRAPVEFATSPRPIYKTESPRQSSRSATEETRPIVVRGEPREVGGAGGERRSEPEPTEEQVIVARAEHSNGRSQHPAPEPAPARDDAAEQALRAGRCPTCHADITRASVFCPQCGRVL